VTVEVELRAEWTPRRYAQKAESEHLVDEVKVVVDALAAVRPQMGHTGLLVVPWPIRRTELHHREDVHQPRMSPSLGDDLADAILLPVPLRLLDVLDLDAFLGSNTLGVGPNGLPERLRELGGVIEEPNPSVVERGRHRLRVADTR